MKTISQKEEELFDRWIVRNGPAFTIDGVVDEKEYINQKTKILYVLKEGNWEECDDRWELKASLQDVETNGRHWRTWNNIVRWTKALLENGAYPCHVSNEDKAIWTKKIAFIELKKKPGGRQSVDEKIREYVERDKDLLKEQILLYSPDIIICCGRGEGKNADLLYDYVFDNSIKSKWSGPLEQLTENKYNYFTVVIEGKTVPVISFVHPQMRGGHEAFKKKYDDMKEIGQFFGICN